MSQAGEIDVIGNNPQIPVTFVTDDGDAVPIANTLEILGTYVPAGTIPVETTGSGNTVTIEVQTSQAVAGTDVTRIGLAAFNSAQFTVDANGFVSTSGGGIGNTITGQSGGALSPTLGNWNIFGASVAAGSSPVVTSGAVSTLTVNVQRAQALAAADATKVGLANFDSTSFAVDANGFVTLAGGGLAVDSFQVQAITAPGVNPVTPTAAGLITFNGAAVANHSVPLETRSRALNTINIEAQYATSAAATDATKSGIAHFDSTAFTVDSSGFVQLVGGSGPAIDSITVDAFTGPGTNPVVPTGSGVVTVTGAQVATGTVGANVIRTNSVAANAYTIEIQRSTAVAATDSTKNGVSHYDSAVFSVDANGFVSSNATGLVKTLTPDLDFDDTAATAVSPQSGNINVLSYNPSVANVTNTYNSTGAATGNLQVEHKAWLTALVVDPSTTIGTRGTFSTIASALTAASSGQTIFIRPGTYTENLTLKAGVNLTSFESSSSLDGTGQVIISGTCTMTTAGSVTISGIQLQTNSAALLAVTGSAASIVNLNNCYLNCTNATGITFSSSSASSIIRINYCNADIGTTGISLFAHSGAGTLRAYFSSIGNSGSSLTASTCSSSGNCTFVHSLFNINFTTSSTSNFGVYYTQIDVTGFNITAATVGGSGTNFFVNSSFFSGTASAISISQTLTIHSCSIGSSNTNAITGAGTINYSGLTFQSSSSTINVTTKTIAGTLQGSKNTAPTAGFLGEQIRSFVGAGSPVSLSNNTAANVTSISLTAGIWDVSSVMNYSGNTVTGTAFESSINTTSATRGAQGDNNVSVPTPPTSATPLSLSIPSYRLTLSSTTTVYLVAYSLFSAGTNTAYGRISGTRVG